MIRRTFASSVLIFIADATARQKWSPPTGMTRANRICGPRAITARVAAAPMSTNRLVRSASVLRR